MAYLNGTFIGYSMLLESASLPPVSSYTKVTLYGGQSIFDKLHIREVELTNDQIKSIDPTAEVTWLPTTILLANFDQDTLDGGNVIALPDTLTGWLIYRTDTSDNTSTLVATVDANTKTYTDYSVATNRTYYYELFPITANAIGQVLTTDEITTDFFGWYLMDYENPSIVYLFDLNLVSGELSNEVNVAEYETYTQKPVFGKGQRDYIKGTISCIAGTINADGTLYQPVDYLDNLRSFINNGRTKRLKSRKGHVWKIFTYGMPMQTFDQIEEQPITISFNFSEVI